MKNGGEEASQCHRQSREEASEPFRVRRALHAVWERVTSGWTATDKEGNNQEESGGGIMTNSRDLHTTAPRLPPPQQHVDTFVGEVVESSSTLERAISASVADASKEQERFETAVAVLFRKSQNDNTMITKTSPTSPRMHAYTQLCLCPQQETWDCGAFGQQSQSNQSENKTLLSAVSSHFVLLCLCVPTGSGLHSNDSALVARHIDTKMSLFDGKDTRMLTSDEVEERDKMLRDLGTESIWTIDLVFLLETLIRQHDEAQRSAADMTTTTASYLFCSQTLQVNTSHNGLDYYQKAFSRDEVRVNRLFAQAQTMGLPTLCVDSLGLSQVVNLVSNDNCVAMVLMDSFILRGKKQTIMPPDNVQQQQQGVVPDNAVIRSAGSESDTTVCGSLHNSLRH